MKREDCDYTLQILKKLMIADRPLTTTDLVKSLNCDRKTVYNVMVKLEVNGFGVEIIPGNRTKPNQYRFVRMY